MRRIPAYLLVGDDADQTNRTMTKKQLTSKERVAQYKAGVAEHEAWISSKGFLSAEQYVLRARVLIRDAAKADGVVMQPRIKAKIRLDRDYKTGKTTARCAASVAARYNHALSRSTGGLFGSMSYGLPGGIRWEVALLNLKTKLNQGKRYWDAPEISE